MCASPVRSPIVLWANSTLNRLHEDWQSSGSIDEVRLTQGDSVMVELHWLKSVSQIGLIHDEVVFPSNANITLAIGRIDAAPDAGVFSLGYGGQHTADLDFDATPAEVQAALNALSLISAEGGVTVSKTSTTYKIVWNDPGVLGSSLTTYSNDLLPNSTIGIGLARAGTTTVAAIYNVHIKQAPVAACTTWESVDTTNLTIAIESTVINGFQKMRTWVLEFSALPRGGSFTISWVSGTGTTGTSLEIDIDSMTPSGVNLAFQQSGAWGPTWFISTSKRTALTYSISVWVSTNDPSSVIPIVSMSVTNDNVTDFSTKQGLLSLNTVEVEALLAGQSSVQATMEIEVEIDGSRQTIIQTSVVIVNDLIDTDVYDLVEWGSVVPADSIVRYDTSQNLTTGQKAQARANIGAIDLTALDVLIAKDTELELLIGGQNLTTNELAAIKGANTPSGTNLFLTKSAADALYAALTHQHLPSQIIGLQATLDGYDSSIGSVQAAVTLLQTSKAEAFHSQPTSTITGLNDILADFDTRIAGFAPFNHTHDIDDVTDLENRLAPLELFKTEKEPNVPTDDQKAALDYSDAPADNNPFTTVSKVELMLSGLTTGLATEIWTQQQILDSIAALTFTTIDSSQPNGNTGTHMDNADFPLEILIADGGTSYWIPARLA